MRFLLFLVGVFGDNSFSCGITGAIAIALELLFRCLHSLTITVDLLGVIYNANLNFILSPLLIGSLMLIMLGIILIILLLKNLHIQFIGFKYIFKLSEYLKHLFRVKIIYMKISYLRGGGMFSKCFE